jgi:hypothetical protein
VAPRTRRNAQPVEARLPPDVAADVRAGIEEAMRGEFVDLSAEESWRYIETGELPERVERWLDAYDSRHGT